MNNQIEKTLDSREVAEMVEKEHNKLLRDIRKYEEQFTEAKIGLSDFFLKSEYKDGTGRTLPCYRITKKGCEFISHKLTGIKGTIFTARYINRFHEMQDMITQVAESKEAAEPELPWFVRKFMGDYIVLERDFIRITGVDIRKHKAFYREEYFTIGEDWNGWSWHTVVDRENFKEEYGFDYGEDEILRYFYLSGVKKALGILARDRTIHMNEEAEKLLIGGISAPYSLSVKTHETHEENVPMAAVVKTKKLPSQINISITLGDAPKITLE